MRDIDPPEQPCDVCGNLPDDCICPECATCGTVGDPKCYDEHGLVRTPAQIISKTEADRVAAECAAQEAEADARLEQQMKDAEQPWDDK